jgi:hypothetical protein
MVNRADHRSRGWWPPSTAAAVVAVYIAFGGSALAAGGLVGDGAAAFSGMAGATALRTTRPPPVGVNTTALTTVVVSASTGATMYPGVTGDVALQIHNPNSYGVGVTAVARNGAIAADAGHSGCTTTGVTFVNQSSLTIDIPANSDASATLTDAASMSNGSLNACQGATFTIPVRLTGTSN